VYAPGPPGAPVAGLDRLGELAGTGPDHPVLAFHARTRARHLVSTGRHEAALRVLAGALAAPDLDPGPVTDGRRPLQALELPRLTRVFVSSRADLRARLADTLAASGRLRLASGLWEAGDGPETPELGLIGTRHLYLAGERARARTAYERLLRAHPGHRAEILYNLGVFFARHGDWAAARAQLETLVEESPGHPKAPTARRYLERLAQEKRP